MKTYEMCALAREGTRGMVVRGVVEVRERRSDKSIPRTQCHLAAPASTLERAEPICRQVVTEKHL
jgi:hypothetical protein